MMKGLGSTPILEDSDWAWHPEVEHPSQDHQGVDKDTDKLRSVIGILTLISRLSVPPGIGSE